MKGCDCKDCKRIRRSHRLKAAGLLLGVCAFGLVVFGLAKFGLR